MLRRRMLSLHCSLLLAMRSSATITTVAHPTARGQLPRVGVRTSDDTYEDERWLEAQLVDYTKHTAAEERYAAQKQHEILVQWAKLIRSQTDKTYVSRSSRAAQSADRSKEALKKMRRDQATVSQLRVATVV